MRRRLAFWLALLPGVALCAVRFPLDLWYDEVYTLYNYAAKPFLTIATDYSAPNNHILFSMVLRPFYWGSLLTGTDWILRVAPFLFSVGTLCLLFWLADRSLGLPVAVVSTVALGLTQMFLVHTMQLRGYGMSMWLAVGLATLATEDREPTLGWRRFVAIALCGAALLYVMPTNLLVFFPLMLTAMAGAAIREHNVRVRHVVRAMVPWGVALLLAAALYAPVASQVIAARGDLSQETVVARTVGLVVRFYRAALFDLWPVAVVAVPIAVGDWLGRGRRKASHQTKTVIEWLIPTTLVGPFAMAAVLGISPFVRNFCPLLPFVALALGWSLCQAVGAVSRLTRRQWSSTVTTGLGLVAVVVIAGPRIASYPERLEQVRQQRRVQDGYYNYYAARFAPSRAVALVAAEVADGRPYELAYYTEDHYNLLHYLVNSRLAAGRPLAPQAHARRWLYFFEPQSPPNREVIVGDVPLERLKKSPVVAEFGFFRVHRLAP